MVRAAGTPRTGARCCSAGARRKRDRARGRCAIGADSRDDWGCDPIVIWNAPPPPAAIPALPPRFTIG